VVAVVLIGFATAAGSAAQLSASTGRSGPALNRHAGSVYASLVADRTVDARTTLLRATVRLVRPETVLVTSDGSYAPLGPTSAGRIVVEVDGRRASNGSTLDWRGSLAPEEHSFDAIGLVGLPAGRHSVTLVGEPVDRLAGPFVVRATSNLSVLVHPAAHAAARTLGQASRSFDFRTSGINNQPTMLPHTPLLSVRTGGAADVIALASASDLPALPDRAGDPMLGLYLDGRFLGIDRSSWSVNDHCQCAELRAPLAVQGRFLLRGEHLISLDASEFPWNDRQGENPVRYRIGAGGRLVALLGGMNVAGVGQSRLPLTGASPWDYSAIGSSTGWPGVPPVGTNVLLAQETVTIPAHDDGVVLFAAKSRVQGDSADGGGTVSMWLTIDGRRVGSVGLQRLSSPYCESQRSISASYLAAGSGSLSPGAHVVSLYGRAEGTFLHLSLVRDLPLVWFD
jgi:hypothetical protein